MEFRPGTCTSCKAHFKIPTSFTANKAKCSKCGGVVEIGSATSEAAAKPAAASTPATPAKAVSAPVASAAARLAEKPAAAAPTPGAPKPVPARPVPQTPTPAKPASASAKPAPAGAKPAAKPAPVAARKSAKEVEEDDADAHAARRAKLEKKKGPNFALLGGAVVGFAVIGVLVFNFWRKDSEAKAAEQARQAQEKEARDLKQQQEREQLAAAEAAEEKKREEDRIAKEAAAAKAKEEKAAAAAKAKEEKAAAAVAASSEGPAEGFDLSTIPDFGPFEGTTPEQWEEIQATAAVWFDPLAGAKSSKARVKLEENPRQSFPAILNGLKKLNLEDEDGYRLADATQKMLEKICHGHNAGWKYRNEKNWLQYDQKAIKLWCDMWTKASTDDAYWQKLTKQDQAAPAEGAGEDAPKAPPTQKPDDF